MTLLAARDSILRNLHDSWLKELGFVMRSRRSERHDLPMHRAVGLLSFNTNSADWVDFDVTLHAAHDEYNPFSAYGLKSGLGHKDVQLITIGLAELSDSTLRNWSLKSQADADEVFRSVMVAFEAVGLPLLNRIGSLEGVVGVFSEKGPSYGFKPRSWALRRLGEKEEAIKVVQAAIAAAPHQKAKEHAESWLAQIDG